MVIGRYSYYTEQMRADMGRGGTLYCTFLELALNFFPYFLNLNIVLLLLCLYIYTNIRFVHLTGESTRIFKY